MGIFIDFFSSILIFLDSIFNSIGLTIIVFTILIRLVLLPLTLPSIKSGKKIKELQPELNKLKAKHGSDKQALALAQAQLYKSYNINPLSGCLPQLLQLAILIILYQSIIRLVKTPDTELNMTFLWTNLGTTDRTLILPVIAGIFQFLLSIMISPATQTQDLVPNDSKLKKIQDANKKEEDVAEMAATMQQQMVFMMPLMTVIAGMKLPAGLALYWIVGTIMSMLVQYFVSGLGGLAIYWNKYFAKLGPFKNKYLPITTGKSLTAVPKKMLIKKKSFIKTADSSDLANTLKNLGGNTLPIKPKNTRATKVKKTNRRRKK